MTSNKEKIEALKSINTPDAINDFCGKFEKLLFDETNFFVLRHLFNVIKKNKTNVDIKHPKEFYNDLFTFSKLISYYKLVEYTPTNIKLFPETKWIVNGLYDFVTCQIDVIGNADIFFNYKTNYNSPDYKDDFFLTGIFYFSNMMKVIFCLNQYKFFEIFKSLGRDSPHTYILKLLMYSSVHGTGEELPVEFVDECKKSMNTLIEVIDNFKRDRCYLPYGLNIIIIKSMFLLDKNVFFDKIETFFTVGYEMGSIVIEQSQSQSQAQMEFMCIKKIDSDPKRFLVEKMHTISLLFGQFVNGNKEIYEPTYEFLRRILYKSNMFSDQIRLLDMFNVCLSNVLDTNGKILGFDFSENMKSIIYNYCEKNIGMNNENQSKMINELGDDNIWYKALNESFKIVSIGVNNMELKGLIKKSCRQNDAFFTRFFVNLLIEFMEVSYIVSDLNESCLILFDHFDSLSKCDGYNRKQFGTGVLNDSIIRKVFCLTALNHQKSSLKDSWEKIFNIYNIVIQTKNTLGYVFDIMLINIFNSGPNSIAMFKRMHDFLFRLASNNSDDDYLKTRIVEVSSLILLKFGYKFYQNCFFGGKPIMYKFINEYWLNCMGNISNFYKKKVAFEAIKTIPSYEKYTTISYEEFCNVHPQKYNYDSPLDSNLERNYKRIFVLSK